MHTISLSGPWECSLPGLSGTVVLPGTLDEAGLGFPDDPARQWKAEEVRRIGFWREGDPIVTRLTRKYTWEGPAVFRKVLSWNPPAGSRVFLDCERTRQLRCAVNGAEAPVSEPVCLSAPAVFELTGLLTGQDELVLTSDNSYPGWPRDAIVYSSAASDETQTNWNGILGCLRLRVEQKDFISHIRVLPRGDRAEIRVELNLSRDLEGTLRIVSPALREEVSLSFRESAGCRVLSCAAPLRPDALRWDLGAGVLHPLTVHAAGMESRTVFFGIRDFAVREGHLTLNGRRIFLRGETNCAAFPETGYIPAGVDDWKAILERYRSYGVNCVRFHSHCPPEAAFTAADQAGMLLQPELSHWDPEHAFSTEEARNYYALEARQIFRYLANHPSFVMLSFGNELQYSEESRPFVRSLLEELRSSDPTRLCADSSNPFYGAKGPNPAAGFFSAAEDRGRMLRATSADFTGWLNREEPGTCRDYSAAVDALRRDSDQPVFSFEVGQYEVLPDFGQLADYRGVTLPENLRHMQRKVRSAGLEPVWPQMVEASGELSLQCYRAEVEAALRTGAFSGISLLSLQDFPGQGTALVGMMDAHLQPKPYAFAKPERFAAFFRDVLPLALLPRFVFTAGEELCFSLRIANYSREDLDAAPAWSLTGDGYSLSGELPAWSVPAGSLSDPRPLRIPLPAFPVPVRLTLTLRFADSRNEYPLWVCPDVRPVCPPEILECRALDADAFAHLAAGGKVYLSPDSTAEALPSSVQAQFSTDFWSVCTFPTQSGCMGQWIDADHPLFRLFPTDSWTSWQWHPMASRRAILLPRRMKAIVTVLDSCPLLRPMAQLFECRCGGGSLLVSSLGLHQLDAYPAARALRQAVYQYMASPDFRPSESLLPDEASAFLPCG